MLLARERWRAAVTGTAALACVLGCQQADGDIATQAQEQTQTKKQRIDTISAAVISTFEDADAVAMTVSFTEPGGDEGVAPVLFDVLMAQAGRFRVRATQKDGTLFEIACDGQHVVEWNRKSNQWTRYPVTDRENGRDLVRLWTDPPETVTLFGSDQDDEVSLTLPLSRFAESWVTRPSHYRWFFQRLRMADEYETSTESIDGRQCELIAVKQSKSNGPLKMEQSVRAAYDTHTHVPVLEEMTMRVNAPFIPAPKGDRFVYKKIRFDPPIRSSAFTLEPPDGVEFVDPKDLRPAVSTAVGKSVKDFEVALVDGQSRPLVDPDHHGPTIVVAWATWCTPCKGELATLQRLRDMNDPDFAGVPVVAVSIDNARSTVRAFLHKHPLPFPVAWAPDFLDRLNAAGGVPRTLVIDSESVITSIQRGWADDPSGAGHAIERLRQALQEAAQ